MYLGTELDPRDYYRLRSGDYDNPHTDGIRLVIDRHMHWLEGTILDLGCGSGLATAVLWSLRNPIIGVDAEPAMIERYKTETEHDGVVGNFWDKLPAADSAVFCYCLHLCPVSRASMVGFRLAEAGIKKVVVVSPFKERNERWPGFVRVDESADGVGPDGKTIYGRVYARGDA
jgi:SAM-dependent methyltransferase